MENKSRLKHTWEQVSHGVGAYASVLIAVIVLGIAFSFASPYFFTGANLKNIGVLCNSKNIYFVPFGQDNYEKKPNSLVAHTQLLIPTLEMALEHKQYQPILMDYQSDKDSQ